jgi:cytochrome c oxidase subunit 2
MNELMRRILFLPEQGTAYAREVDHLHYFIAIVTLLGATVVFSILIAFIVVYRRRRANQSTPHIEPKPIHEAVFIGLPTVLFLTWFAIGFPQYVALQTPPKNATDIYVQAKQWMWQFAYPGGPNSNDVLRVPVGRPVRLLLTSRDVIHAFWVPAFRLKQDVLPGRYTQTWFQAERPGEYDIFCAQYCGTNHSAMLGKIVAMPPDEFDAWLADQRRGIVATQDSAPVPSEGIDVRTSLLEQGRRLASEYGCFKCHTVDGTQHIGPSWLDLYRKRERLTTGKTVLADEAYLTRSMMDPGADIVAGYQNIMPTYQGQVSEEQILQLIAYIQSLKGTPAGPQKEAASPAPDPAGVRGPKP